jgi:hypothetical protein
MKDFKRDFFYLCAEKFQSWSDSIMRRLGAEEREEKYSPDVISSHNKEGKTDGHIKKAGKVPPPEKWDTSGSAGPPEHWLELVRRSAPELLKSLEEDPVHNTSEFPDEKKRETTQQPGGETREKAPIPPPSFENKTSGHRRRRPEVPTPEQPDHQIKSPNQEHTSPPPRGKKKKPNRRHAAPNVSTPEQSGHQTEIPLEEQGRVSQSPLRKKKTRDLRHAAPNVSTPEQSGHEIEIPSEEHASGSEGVQKEKRIPGHRNAHTNVTTPGQSGHYSKITAGKNVTTNDSSSHIPPATQSTDQVHSFTGDSSQTSIARNSVKKFTHDETHVKMTEPEQLFKPGTVMGTEGKPALTGRNLNERIIKSPPPDTSPIKPSRHDRQNSKTSTSSSPVENTEKSSEHPGKNVWPRLTEELAVGSGEIGASVSSSWKGGGNLWPELPQERPPKSYDELIINHHERERLRRVDREQMGILWNA